MLSSLPSWMLCSLLITSSFAATAAERQQQPKKEKAHYAGVRKPAPKEKSTRKKRSSVKNKWVASKTHPKERHRQSAEEDPIAVLEELPEDRPYFQKIDYPISSAPSSANPSVQYDHLEARVEELEQEIDDAKEFPKTGVQAPRGHAYLTGEWLYWRARQEGMEYATGHSLHFNYTSGFRVGVGGHLPADGWDIYANYTRITPEHSNHLEGGNFPQWCYGANGFVTESHAHWKIGFQSADLELGRAYYLSSSLSCRPYFGMKGGWVDQRARIGYAGGIVPVGQIYTVRLKNDFKGAGPRIGWQSYWHLGAGFSLFSDMAAALLIGIFNNHQIQRQLNGSEPIRLETHQNLVSPNLQLVAGLGWDRNFRKDRCHFGIRAGFEGQMYWNQNQMERFTNPTQPIYLREGGNLSFHGLSLQGRFDF